MLKSGLEYNKLVDLIKPYSPKGRSESANFLNWFLEHIYRLDDVTCDDSICDTYNDKGIDGIYVDEINEEIHVLQAKISKKLGRTIGDTELKTFSGSLDQLSSGGKIDIILKGNANDELKRIIKDINLKEKLKNNFKIIGVFVTNQDKDKNTTEYLKINKKIKIYDRELIVSTFVDVDEDDGVKGRVDISCDQSPLSFPVSNVAQVYIFAASAIELVKLSGIGDGSLFSRNVRFSLGNTKVNRDIVENIIDKKEHVKFPLYHNGITMLCKEASYDNKNKHISVKDYSVVNGAQSLSSLYSNKEHITKDLSLIVKLIELKNDATLANAITINSNNQNSIKPRDMRSNHIFQKRLKAEFAKLKKAKYDFEIKRGESSSNKEVITNEDAGRLLLAFDRKEPWSCHQIYKVFDDLYSDIFGRPEVNAERIIFLHETMKRVVIALEETAENKPFNHYTLTKYFILTLLSEILNSDNRGQKILLNPSGIVNDDKLMKRYLDTVGLILSGIVVDLQYQFNELQKSEDFDYKKNLKSPQKVKELIATIKKEFDKDVARKKVKSFQTLWMV